MARLEQNVKNIEENTKRIEKALETFQDLKYVPKQIADIINSFDEFKEEVKSTYVTRVEFEPIQKLVYTMIGIVLTTVLAAILALVINVV